MADPPDGDAKLGELDTLTARAGRAPTKDAQPQTIGRFEIRELVGSGGMGVVYRAYDPSLERDVALKLLHSEVVQSPERRARLPREARAMAKIAHPNVIHVYEVGSIGADDFVAMELVDGPTLAEWSAQAERSWREILPVFLLAGRGLEAAHVKGLVHRDFKPSNVLIASDDRVMVTDFGLAVGAGADQGPRVRGEVAKAGSVTQTGMLVGTPAYMAPEQFASSAVDERADQFAFAVSLYEALFGVRPFADDTVEALRAAAAEGRIASAHEDSGVPARVRRVVLRGLRGGASERYPDMTSMLADLEGCLGHRRRWVIPAAAAILLAAVGAFLWLRPGPSAAAADGCDEVDKLFDEAWSPENRATTSAAFDATSASPEAFDGVAKALDNYRANWEQQYGTLCEARNRMEEPVFHRTVACLLSRRTWVTAFVRELSEADLAMTELAQQTLVELRAPSTCADAASGSRYPSPPKDPELLKEVREIRTELARVRTPWRWPRKREAKPHMPKIVERARALGYQPVLAEALWELGRGQQRSGDTNAARRAYEEAALVAEEAGYDRLRADVLVDLARLEVDHSSDPLRNERALRRAMAALERIGRDDGLAAELMVIRARFAEFQQRFQDALQLYEQAESLYEQSDNEASRADVWARMTSVVVKLGDPDRAVELARRQLAFEEQRTSRVTASVAFSYEALAQSLRWAQRDDEARQYSARAAAFWASPRGRAVLQARNGARRSGTRGLVGRVVDARGNGVARAEVVAVQEELPGDGTYMFATRGGQWEWRTGLRRVLTDESGAFELAGLPHDSALCVAAEQEVAGRSEYVRLAPASGTTRDVELGLRPFGSIRGALDPPMKSPQLLHLHALPATEDGDPWACRLEIPIAPDGSYHIPRVPAGRHRILLVTSDSARRSVHGAREVKVAPGKTTVADIATPPTGVTLVVEVRSSAAVAVQGAAVAVLPGRVSPLPRNGAEVLAAYGREASQGDTRLDFATQATGAGTVLLRFANLRRGEYTLCGAATPGDLRDWKLREKLWEHRDEITATCQDLTIAESPAEQKVLFEVPPMARLSE